MFTARESIGFLAFVKMKTNITKSVQYACAVCLIVSSIILAFIQVINIDDVNNGTLMYIAQSFLLAGSIFGLDYYVKKLTKEAKQEKEMSNEI